MLNRAGSDGLTFVGGMIRQFGVGILIHGGAPHPV
jgi:hypothetical protein